MATRYACPCCGYLTLPEEPPGTFDICPVCGFTHARNAPDRCPVCGTVGNKFERIS